MQCVDVEVEEKNIIIRKLVGIDRESETIDVRSRSDHVMWIVRHGMTDRIDQFNRFIINCLASSEVHN